MLKYIMAPDIKITTVCLFLLLIAGPALYWLREPKGKKFFSVEVQVI